MNYEGKIEIRSEIRGDHRNAGVERYNDLNKQHLVPVSEEVVNDRMDLVVRTSQSGVGIALCARNIVRKSGKKVQQTTQIGGGWLGQTFTTEGVKEQEIVLEKCGC